MRVNCREFRLQWRVITKNARVGDMVFSALSKLPDAEYVFTLQKDYGVKCAAVSERFKIEAGRIVSVQSESCLLSADTEMSRKQRQQGAKGPGTGLSDVSRAADKDADVVLDQQYFPITNIDVTLSRDWLEAVPLVKTIYRIVDKESYLDWGLTSDYESAGGAQA